jgi:CDP-glucose 4,6-dehydratase
MNGGIFGGVFRQRRVLITGHTGFKGSWLSYWLGQLGAQVTGLALEPDTTPALFDLLQLRRHLDHRCVDIRDADAVHQVVADIRPEVVLHLAAQPLVRLSYREPKATWDVNVGGTVNLLEAIRRVGGVRACVVVTSDKCYENREWPWGYRETEPMGGHDPYSASKGATELLVSSWRRSFAAAAGCRLASARAGNVIGGGDWAQDRIVVDFIAAITAGRPLELRNPSATRPWQHVLEPLSGYLALTQRLLADDGAADAEGWNFGPSDASIATVMDLAQALVRAWGSGTVIDRSDPAHPHEAGLLKLDASRARQRLGWHGVWDVTRTVEATVAWYRTHTQGGDVAAITAHQLDHYVADAVTARLPWTLA